MKTLTRTDERILTSDIFERDARGGPRPDLGEIVEAARKIPVYRDCEVLVVGGGPSGTAAALAAAKLGADTMLVERYNHLGGLSTGGLVIWIDRMTDWEGRLVIRGFAEEVLDRLPPDAIAGPPHDDWGTTDSGKAAHWSLRTAAYHGIVTWSPTIDPERLKLASQEMLIERGVRLAYHAWACMPLLDERGPTAEGGPSVPTAESGPSVPTAKGGPSVPTAKGGPSVRVAGITFESKEGRMAIRAKVVVDATGDGDLFARAGAEYDDDIKADDIHHCMNTSWLFGGVDMQRWLAFRGGNPDGYAAFMAAGRAACGLFDRPFVSWRDDIALFMGPRQSGYSALDVDDLTAVEVLSHRAMAKHLDFYRAHAPGFEQAYMMLSAPQIGVRHARRLRGVDAVLRSRWSEGTALPDEIGVTPAVSPKFPNISIPYGSLLPVQLDGLLACGRHVACDTNSHGFMREIPQCWITGQAAGAAGALAVKHGVTPRQVDIGELQRALLDQGVYLRRDEAVQAAAQAEKVS